MNYDYIVVGAGFAGATIAERLANDSNKKVLILDKRETLGGNMYDYVDENGILVHKYGPHLFHTNLENVYNYLKKFGSWFFYEHKTNEKHKAILQGAKRIHRSAMRQCNKAQSIQPERRRTITYMEEGTT